MTHCAALSVRVRGARKGDRRAVRVRVAGRAFRASDGLLWGRAFPHIEPRPHQTSAIGSHEGLRSIKVMAVIQFDKRPAVELPLVVDLAHSVAGMKLVQSLVALGWHALGE